MTLWLADPETGEMLAMDDRDRLALEEVEKHRKWAGHWRKGWLRGVERNDSGAVVAMWWRQCFEECCK